MRLREQDTWVWGTLTGEKMLSTESSVYVFGNTLKHSGVRDSCGAQGWQGWPGGRAVMESGGGHLYGPGDSLLLALHPGLREWFLGGIVDFQTQGECFSQRLSPQAKSSKPPAVKHPCRPDGGTSGNAAEAMDPNSPSGPSCSPALQGWSGASPVTGTRPSLVGLQGSNISLVCLWGPTLAGTSGVKGGGGTLGISPQGRSVPSTSTMCKALC